MTITLYTFKSASGEEHSYSTQDATEADVYARRSGTRLYANEYEWANAEMIEDYTQTESEVAS